MKPNQTFSFVQQATVQPDELSLTRCYLPIIGNEAFATYHTLCAFYDNGLGRYPLSRLLNHLNCGIQQLQRSLETLAALKLLRLYREEQHWMLAVEAPLDTQEFLKQEVYRSLLETRIGEPEVARFAIQWPKEETAVAVNFADVFDVEGRVQLREPKVQEVDVEAFKAMMARDNLRFQDETSDVVALHYLAKKYSYTWLELYQLAKSTAVNLVISVKRMEAKTEAGQGNQAQLTQAERVIARESKSKTPLEFLTMLKDSRKAAVIPTERTLLQQIAQLGLLDEVINVILLYTFNKVDSANVNEKYALKVANDFSYRKIRSVEEAILALRENPKKQAASTRPAQSKNNVPEWSKKEVNTQKTAEGQAALEALRKKLMAKEKEGGA